MTILVTGASGFIGTHLTSYLSANDIDFYGLSSSELDLTNELDVKSFFNLNTFSSIIHLAAVGLRHCESGQSNLNDLNVIMAENILKYIRPNQSLLLAGSMSEYGFSGTHKETDICSPRTEYGKSKLRVSQLSVSYSQERNIDSRVVRIYGVYGQYENPERLFPSLLSRLSSNQSISLSDCNQRRDFVHVKDLSSILLNLISPKYRSCFDIVNVGTGHAVRVKDVILSLAKEFGASLELLRFGERKRSPGDEDLLCADVSLLSSMNPSLVPFQRLSGSKSMLGLFS